MLICAEVMGHITFHSNCGTPCILEHAPCLGKNGIVTNNYRVTHLIAGNNLLLTLFRQFWQLVGRFCSYLLPRQDNGLSFKNLSQWEVVTILTGHPVTFT